MATEIHAATATSGPPTLLRAGLSLAAVMRFGGRSLEQAADRIEWADPQPYPLTYVVMSNHVAQFLRALARAEAEDPVPEVPTAQGAAPNGQADPAPLRESSVWTS